MKIMQRIPSYAALATAIAVVGFAARSGMESWRNNMLEPDRILMSLTFIGVAILLWPLSTNQPTQT